MTQVLRINEIFKSFQGEGYHTGKSAKWNSRTEEIFSFWENNLVCKLHGLRMLNKKIFTKYPYYSGDSTNIARNIEFYRKRHRIKTRLESALAMAKNIESCKSTYNYDGDCRWAIK